MNQLFIIFFLLLIIFLLYWVERSKKEEIFSEIAPQVPNEDRSFSEIPSSSNKDYRTTFRTEIDKGMERANSTHNKSSIIYKAYSKANLYFLKPFISKKEYTDLSFRIGNTWTPDTPRYIEPDLLIPRH